MFIWNSKVFIYEDAYGNAVCENGGPLVPAAMCWISEKKLMNYSILAQIVLYASFMKNCRMIWKGVFSFWHRIQHRSYVILQYHKVTMIFPCYLCNSFFYGDIQIWFRKECFVSDVDTKLCFPLMRIVIVPESPIMSRLAFYHIIRIEQVNTDRECCNSSPVGPPADHNWPYEPTWPMQDS